MASALKKSRSLRKLNDILAAIIFFIIFLGWVPPGLTFAQPPLGGINLSSVSSTMLAGAGNDFNKAGIKISIDYTSLPAAAADRLAKALTDAATADEIRPAAYEALARSGMTIKSPAEVFAPAGPRVLKRWLLPAQADNLSLDFLEHQGWTLTELTRASAEFPGGPGPGLLKRPETLGLLLREWAAIAEQSPNDPEAFAPLLLARIAQIRGGGSDFTQGEIIPEQIELSYLELMILTAGAVKGVPQSQGASQSSGAASDRVGLTSWWDPFFAQPAYAGDGGPCSWFKDNLEIDGETAQDFAEEGAGFLMDKALEKVGEWLQSVGDGVLAKGLGQTVSVFKVANFLTSMISAYGGYSLTLTWDPAKPHYLGNEHGDATMKIIANVSTRPLADDATLACLKFIGIERPSSDSMKDTTVEWVPLYGTPRHAQAKLPPSSRENVSAEGKAVLELTMAQESLGDEVKKNGKLKKDQIVMQANLIVYKSNPGKILAAALFGGVAGGNIEALKGWVANWFPKRAVARVPVEWHKLSRWRLVVDVPGVPLRIVYTSGLGTKSIWDWTLEGDPRFSGSGKFDLNSGSARFVMPYKMVDDGVTVETKMPKTVRIGGTAEEPTLIIGVDGNVNITASGNGEGGGSVTKNIKGEKEFQLEEIE